MKVLRFWEYFTAAGKEVLHVLEVTVGVLLGEGNLDRATITTLVSALYIPLLAICFTSHLLR